VSLLFLRFYWCCETLHKFSGSVHQGAL